MRRVPLATTIAAAALAVAPAVASAVPATGDRPAGNVFSWSHELNQNELPSWRPETAPPIPPRRWYRIIDEILATAGANGLWFSGVSALPFPPLPLSPREPVGWRTPARYAAAHRRTGLSWDVAYEVWAARRALERPGTVIADPAADPVAYTRRLSLLDPNYRREALREIRRIVPRLKDAPYVNAYSGSDEPVLVLPRGRKALASPFARTMRREMLRRYGVAPPDPLARPTRSPAAGLRWLAYTRWSEGRFFAMKREQAELIRRLDPGARVSPNDYGFIDGFAPWDYTRLAGFADMVEADPYVSYAERDRPGRGRYNPGFGAKLMSDLTGKRVRIIVQAFPYSRYDPEPGDLWTWSAQALRAGATDISFYASQNPRFTDRPLYETQLAVARSLRGTRLPAPPADPEQLVLYATASEGQGQPERTGGTRYKTSGDALYTAYGLLGELSEGAFSFDSDARLMREPARLATARTLWMPRGDTLDRPFAEALLAWVRAGGTLIVTDPAAFTRTPRGASLEDVRAALIGAPLGPRRTGSVLEVPAGALTPELPAEMLTLPVDAPVARAFAAVPPDAAVVARFLDGAPAALLRPVGAGRVVAFASDVMQPSALAEPFDLARFTADLHRFAGGTLGHPAWAYRIPGDPAPVREPWAGAVPTESAGP